MAAAITVYGNSVFLKSLGMFIQGSLHVKVTLCYSHMYELSSDNRKGTSALVLNLTDASILLITGLFIKFCSNDLVVFYQYVYII